MPIGLGIGLNISMRGGLGGGFSLDASGTTVAETAALNDVIGTLSVSNLGALTVSSYAITADPDNKFDLDGDDLIVDGTFDYTSATSHSVTIRATLSDASTVDRTFTISITPLLQAGVTRTVAAMRTQAITAIFGSAALPTGGIDSINTGVSTPLTISAPANLASVDEISVDVGAGADSSTHYKFNPTVSNGEAVIYHAGHGSTIGVDNRQEWIAAQINAGFTVVAMRMPYDGENAQHDALTDPADLKHFIEPPIRIFNYLVDTAGFDPDGIFLSGFSGGGWTAVVVAAIDPRITASAPYAGSLPLYISDDIVAEWTGDRDWEQFLPGLSGFLDYTDLYVMSADSGREQIVIGNDEDDCCFMLSAVTAASHAFNTRVASAVTAVGGTHTWSWQTSATHQITSAARTLMLDLFARNSVVAPVLSSATDTETSDTAADLAVTTSDYAGTLYTVVTTSATAPTAAQIKAGLDHASAAAAFADDQVISSIGNKTFSATSLTPETAYYAHFMHEDAAGNQSNVASGNGFTTEATPSGYTFVNAEAEAVVTAFSVEPDNTRKELIDDLVGTMKADDTWDDIDYLYVHAAHHEQAGRVNWKNPGTATATSVNSMAFTADEGFNTDGSTSYLSFGVAFNAINVTQNDCHLGGKVTGTLADTQSWLAPGRPPSTGTFNIQGIFQSGAYDIAVRLAQSSAFLVNSVGAADGYFIATRRSSTEVEVYKNGASISTQSSSSSGVGSGNAETGRSNGAVGTATTIKYQVTHWGVQLSDAKAAALDAAFDTYFAGL